MANRKAALALVLTLGAFACREVSGPTARAHAFVYVENDGRLGFRAADGSLVSEIPVDLSGLVNPIVIATACSPDRARATYVRAPQTGLGYGFFVVSSDGSNLRQLTVAGAQIGPGAWSPTGDRIAVRYSKPGDAAGMAIINADGTVLATVAARPATLEILSWSPDGTEILYTSEDLQRRVMAVSVTTGTTRQVAASGMRPRWSPDGQRIAFLAPFSPNLVVANKDGTSASVLVTAGGQMVPHSFTWTPDGRILVETDGKLYFVSLDGTIKPFIVEGVQRDVHWCGTP